MFETLKVKFFSAFFKNEHSQSTLYHTNIHHAFYVCVCKSKHACAMKPAANFGCQFTLICSHLHV